MEIIDHYYALFVLATKIPLFIKHYLSIVLSFLLLLSIKIIHVLKLDSACNAFTNESAAILSEKPLKVLTTLSLRGATTLSPNALGSIVVNASMLGSLDLSRCKLTADTLTLIGNRVGTTLKRLYLDGCRFDNKFILGGFNTFLCLEVVSVADIAPLSDAILEGLISINGQCLTTLNICNCGIVTDDGVKQVAQLCPNLEEINLAGIVNLTWSGLASLAYGCRRISRVDLSFTYLSDDVIAAFVRSVGGHLTKFILRCHMTVGYRTADAIASTCTHLRYLDLSHCCNVVDRDLGNIIRNCTSLKDLIISGCNKITEAFKIGHSRDIRIDTIFGVTPSAQRIFLLMNLNEEAEKKRASKKEGLNGTDRGRPT